jgi:hypothetical protein
MDMDLLANGLACMFNMDSASPFIRNYQRMT